MHDKRPDGTERLMLPTGGEIPNNPRLPVLLHRGVLPGGDAAAAEALFARNGWPPGWRGRSYAILAPGATQVLARDQGAG